MAALEFKVFLLGDRGVGKTSFARKHLTGEFEHRYIPSVGAMVHQLHVGTNCGAITFNLWDCTSSDRYGSIYREYYVNSHAALLFFDVTSRITYKNIPHFYRSICRANGPIPLALIGNKVDLADERKVYTRHIKFHRKKGLQYYETSIQTGYNFEKPLLWLARRLLNQPDLQLIGDFARPPAVDQRLLTDEDQMEESEQRLEEALSVPIPLDPCLEEDLVLSLVGRLSDEGDSLQLSCFSIGGEERGAFHVNENELLRDFRNRLAQHLDVTGQRLHLISQSGAMLRKVDDAKSLCDLLSCELVKH